MSKRRSTYVPAIAYPTKYNAEEMLKQIKEVLDIRLGRVGDPLDRAVTVRELVDTGNVIQVGAGSTAGGGGASGPGFAPGWIDLTVPPTPANFTALGAFEVVALSWTQSNQRGHSHTEVYRSTENDFDTRVLIGTSDSTVYGDAVETGSTYYYWIRFVSNADVPGPFNSIDGTEAVTATHAADVAEVLAGRIPQHMLVSSLGSSMAQAVADAQQAASDAQGASEAVTTVVEVANNAQDVANSAKTAADQAVFDAAQARTKANALTETVNQAAADALQARESSNSAVVSASSAYAGNEGAAESLMAALVNQDYIGRRIRFENAAVAVAMQELKSHVEANYAEAGFVHILSANVEGNAAALLEQQQVITSLDEATTTSLSSLTARVEYNSSELLTYGEVIAGLESTSSKLTTSVSSNYYESEEAAEALMQSLVTNDATLERLRYQDAAGALAIQQFETYAEENYAKAAELRALFANVEGNAALLISQAKAVADLETATAEKVDTLEAAVEENAAQLVSQSLAFSDYQTASAQELLALSGRVGGNEAGLVQQAQVVSDLNGSLSKLSLGASSISSDGDESAEALLQALISQDKSLDEARSIKGSFALAFAEMQAYTEENYAKAEAYEVLLAQVDENSAELTRNIKAVTDLEHSTANEIAEIKVRHSANEASLIEFAEVLANVEEASTIQTSVLSAQVGEQRAQIANHTSVIAGIDSAVASFQASFDINGVVAGYGFWNNGGDDHGFIVNAANFFVVGVDGTRATPIFGVSQIDGIDTIVLNADTYIADGAITSAKIQTLAADKIAAGTISVAIKLEAAEITGGSLDIGGGRFKVSNDGSVDINSGTDPSRMEIKNDVIKVFHEGILRVQIGDLLA